MNGVLRHLTVRLWGVALLGSALGVVILPLWQAMVQLQWVLAPMVVIFVLCFLLLGWLMNRLGIYRIKRLINEAGIWERAGLSDDAGAVYERAVAVFDSFWLSPLGRRHSENLISARLVRFYLSQPFQGSRNSLGSLGLRAQALVKWYLDRYPGDTAMARSWLEYILTDEADGIRDDQLVARIGHALADHPDIQMLLMQFYLSARRTDFDAVQTYRRVWRLESDLPDNVLHALAHLLLKNSQLNDWALQVYLKGYNSGDPYCLEGIAAAAQALKSHPGNRRFLDQAQSINESLEPEFREKAIRRFKPVRFIDRVDIIPPSEPSEPLVEPEEAIAVPIRLPEEPVESEIEVERYRPVGLGDVSRSIANIIRSLIRYCRRTGSFLRQKVLTVSRKPWPVLRLRLTMIAVTLSVVVMVALVAGYRLRSRQELPLDANTGALQPLAEIDMPFTIQVAAYLKPEDAQRFVEKLKTQGLDSFSTEAVSSHRKWYQVKVSRFETKLQAREYGEKLKSQGLIDDFYVANYKQ